LGSWWALQEGTWGGWWNWDSSETFGLFFFLLPFFFYHNKSYLNFHQKNLNIFKKSTTLLLFSYFFIQLNFDLVSHNFGIKFFQFFSNNLFFYNTLLTLFFMKIFFNKKTIKNFSSTSLLTYRKKTKLKNLNLQYFKTIN
jgi:cytochrome c biogenesis factor